MGLLFSLYEISVARVFNCRDGIITSKLIIILIMFLSLSNFNSFNVFMIGSPDFAPRSVKSSNRQVKTGLPEGAEQLDLGTTVHHHFQACFFGQLRCAVIINANLAPKHRGADFNGLLSNLI